MKIHKLKFKTAIFCLLAIAAIGGFVVLGNHEAGMEVDDSGNLADKFELRQISGQKDFASVSAPEFDFKFQKRQNIFRKTFAYFKGWFADDYRDLKIQAKITGSTVSDSDRPAVDILYQKNGKFKVKLNKNKRQFRPGKYNISFNIAGGEATGGQAARFSQDFVWGVLAINSNKSVYLPDEQAKLSMAVLDDHGDTICDAKVELEIVDPSGQVKSLRTEDNSIIRNPACAGNTVISEPDYRAVYQLGKIGTYQVKMKAITANGERRIEDKIEVRGSLPFEIERAGPTRIYPRANYAMKIKIKANQDYRGDIVETTPDSFKITKENFKFQIPNSNEIQNSKFKIQNSDDGQKLVWSGIDLKVGDKLTVEYTFDAPDISPELYLVGPAKIGKFEEVRGWQIAADMLEARAKTVQFLAGNWSANGAAGQNTDTNYTFNSFNFSLAEGGVSVKNAYIIFETQFEGYTDLLNSYNGYAIVFDSCQSSCTPSAFSGINTATSSDTTVLAYDDAGSSNEARLLANVTSEGQLAAYTGNGVIMSGQVGYRINHNNDNALSIASTRAILVVTYTYDPNITTNYTNTVIYPLESRDSLSIGTKATSTANNCALNSTCPLFAYKMDLPDYSAASSSRQSQWFSVFGNNYGNGVADASIDVNIQGNDTNSSANVLEAARNDQGHLPAFYFDSVAGYAENTSQLLEYRVNSTVASTYYLIGGEVTETYTASTSAATKTRTVSFPIGVISDGGAVSTSSAATTVYFPENGAATGTVKIKKAWVRIISPNRVSAINNTGVSAKVGNLTQSAYTYFTYRPAANYVAKPSFNIIYVLATTTYAELENANSASGKAVTVYSTANTAGQGVRSAELMITYTYTNEGNGYLTSLGLFGGQSMVNPGVATRLGQSVTIPTANSVIPESTGSTTIRAAAILASYLAQDSDNSVGTTMTGDTNLSTGAPACSNGRRMDADSVNGFFEFYKNVTTAMNTTDNQPYNACYTNNGPSNDTSGGAKMNGILYYTYQWDNLAPTSTIKSISQATDGTGRINLQFEAGDQDSQDLRAKIEYEAGATCAFLSANQTILTTDDASTTATQGDPDVDNNLAYRIGTTSGWIITSGGSNIVNTIWESMGSLLNVDATYCVRLTVNDFHLDQATSATSTILIDNKAPTAPGPLTYYGKTGSSVTFNLGATTTENHFRDYIIYYKIAGGSAVNLHDSPFSSTSDEHLGHILFSGAGSSTVTGLQPGTNYQFNIFAFDQAGNWASGTPITVETNHRPTSTIKYISPRTDNSGKVDITIEVSDFEGDNSRAKIQYELGSACAFTAPLSATLDTDDASATSTVGDAKVDNNSTYQLGTTTGWIVASSGPNQVSFDWNSKTDVPSASSTYCIRVIANDNFSDQSPVATATVILDNYPPVISQVYISNNVYKIGSQISITITADAAGYTLDPSATVNGKPLINFSDDGGGNYSAVYSVAEGDTDRAIGTIPVSIILKDSYDNVNSAFTVVQSNTASVDANKPKILSISLPDDRMFKIGDTVRATATVQTDTYYYSLGTTTINNVDAVNLQKVSDSIYTFDYIVSQGNTDRASGTIPVSLMLKDQVGQYNDPASTTVGANTSSIDAHKPIINNVYFTPFDGVLKIGDTATATIQVDSTSTASTITINSVNVLSSFQTASGTNYMVTYTVAEGDFDRSDDDNLPVNFVVADTFGNLSDTYQIADPLTRPGVDAHRPSITNVQIPNIAYKIGDTLTATITVAADAAVYTLVSTSTINTNGTTTNLQKISDTTYTISHVIVEDEADQTSGNIPISIAVKDPAGNYSNSFTAAAANTASIDAHRPSITNVQIPNIAYKIGDTLTATITVAADAAVYTLVSTSTINTNGTTTNLQKISDTTYTISHVIVEDEADQTSGNIPISIAVKDPAGNYSNSFTAAAANTASIDAHRPSITNVQIPNIAYKIGDTLTATITVAADAAVYTLVSTSTINTNGTTTNLQKISDTTYTISHVIVEDEADQTSGNIPISIAVKDPAGNYSNSFTAAAANTASIDAHRPSITNVQIPNIAYKIGDTLTATITVAADAAVYTLVSTSTINTNGTTTNLQKISDTTYTISHVIVEDEADQTSGNIPISIAVKDPAGNYSNSFTAAAANTASIDAHRPVVSDIVFNPSSGVLKIGGIATATIQSDGTDYAAGTLTINNVNVAATFHNNADNTYRVTYTVAEGNNDISDAVDLPVVITLFDPAGNQSLAYNTADINNRPGVDAHKPTAPGALSFNHNHNNSLTLNFGATTTEDNFAEYKIYYKAGSSGVAESDSVWSSSTDAHLGNILFGETTTTITGLATGTEYVFAIYAYDQAGNKASSSEITAYTNRLPANPTALAQYKDDEIDIINNGQWTNEDKVKIGAAATDPDVNETIALYFELQPVASSTRTATTAPSGACVYGAAYGGCTSQVWFVAPGSPGNYSVNPYIGTSSITSLPDAATGYKWQALACDEDGACSDWVDAGADPNLKVDHTPPTAPGNLTINHRADIYMILNFGSASADANFKEYKIFYKPDASGVTESDFEHSSSTDLNLGYINYYGKSTTTVPNLSASTTYYFNIWAYDQAGNKSNAVEIATTTRPGMNPPISYFNSVAQKTDGSGRIDLSFDAFDQDKDQLMAKIDYTSGSDCNFATSNDPTIDEDIANIAATNDQPLVDNLQDFQIGTSSGYITTNLATNTVSVDWLSRSDVPAIEGTYCLRLTLDDGDFVQATSATSTIYIDNINPTAPGALTLNQKNTNSLVLNFAGQSADTHFKWYKIFYKPGSSGVTENDFEHSSSTDPHLGQINYGGAATTTISGLDPGTEYVFNIWAYDDYGNKASATSEFTATTNYIPAPPASFSQFRFDGVTVVPNNAWTNEDNIKLRASANDNDTSEIITLYFELKPIGGSFTTATTVPAGACAPAADYDSCDSKIWAITSPAGDYSLTPYTGTVNPSNIPDAATGYKWQTMACDDNGACSDWSDAGADPNFKLDHTPPTVPGNLNILNRSAATTTLIFGATSTDENFSEYKIFYKIGAAGVTEADNPHSSTTDLNLASAVFNSATTTSVSGLQSGIQYYFNIWAYDKAGNKAEAITEVSTTTNHYPTGSFVSAGEKTDGSGAIDIVINANDSEGADAKAKLDYAAGAACDFSSPQDPTLDETDANATSTHGDAKIDNNDSHQIGSSTGWIITSAGANQVSFDWLSAQNIPSADGTYCLRLTVNDGIDNQSTSATTTLTIDNVNPTAPGDLTLHGRTANSLTLSFGATTTETNFFRYRIFYKEGVNTVYETDSELVDSNLNFINYYGEATTSVGGLLPNTQYSFKMWAYDNYGHKGTSSQVIFSTNAKPTGVFNSISQKTNGTGIVDISINVYDTNGDNCRAKLEFATGTTCDFSSARPATLDETDANTSATHEDPKVLNSQDYQIGSSSGWIITSSGINTVNFDWQSAIDIPNATSSYCLRLTVNDGVNDQAISATGTIIVDNTAPVAPGNLGIAAVIGNSVKLGFGSPAVEPYFKEYKIFYKIGAAGVTESDSEYNKTNNYRLEYINYSGATSTTVNYLDGNAQYVFNIWAYDLFGNKSSAAAEISTTTAGILPASWREIEDINDPTTSVPIGKERNIRLRFDVANVGDWDSYGYNYRLQYAPKTTDCPNIPAWTSVPITAGAEHFAMTDSFFFADNDPTSARLNNSESYIFTPGHMVEAPSNQTASSAVGSLGYAEHEFVFQPTANATASGTYCFRLENGAQVLDDYGNYPELTIAPPPSSSFVSANQRFDQSGIVDISILAGDQSGDNLKVKIEYATGTTCDFTDASRPTLDETDSNITATYGDPDIDNSSYYQIGTSTNPIITSDGENQVNFDWLTTNDLPDANGPYCLRLIANDGYDDQQIVATTTVTVDRFPPTDPGDLTVVGKTSNSVTLGLGATSSDSYFYEYKIFYKEGDSGVTESDSLHGSSSDINLGSADYKGATTTVVGGLTVNKQYVFRIWAYDQYGNKASSSGEVSVIIKYVSKSENWRWYYDKFNKTPISPAAGTSTAPVNIAENTTLKLRLALREVENVTGENIKVRLQYSTMSDFSSDVHFVGEKASSSEIWTYGDGVDNDNDLIATTTLFGVAFGATHNESGISTTAYSHQALTQAEWEFTIRNNDAVNAATYYFRAYDNRNDVAIVKDSQASYPSLVIQSGAITYSIAGTGVGSTTAGVAANIATTPNSVPFGALNGDAEAIGIHHFVIDTNIGGGYQLFAYQTQNLIDNNGSIINPVSASNDAPESWPGSPNPGYFGYHTCDDTLSGPGASSSRFAPDNTYAKFESNMKEIGYSPIPVSNNQVDLVYRLQVNHQQPAGDYETSIIYILVPTF